MNEKQSFDDKLMEAARALETEVAPERDLWADIESAISRPAGRPWNSIVAQAAAVLVLIGASSGLTYLAVSDGTPAATPPPTVAPLRVEHANFGGHYMLGPDYMDARRGLKARMDEKLTRLSPEARADIQKNLEAIRSVIEEINRALSNDPDNALLQELLLSSYQEELALMMKVNGIANAAMYRTDF